MPRDTSGEKYLILKEMGETIDMTFGRVHLDTGKVDWLHRPHNISDGVGAFTDLLNRDGNHISEQPLMKPGAVPSLWQRLLLLRQHLKNMRPCSYDWKFYRPSRGVGTSLAWTLFDRGDTTALLDYARANKVSLNAVLLQTLNEVCCDTLLRSPPEETVWTIPLNLRGGASSGNTSSNVTASISLRLPPSPEARYIDERIKTIYQQGVHWGAWLLSNLTAIVGKRGFRFLAERARPVWMGVFSNVGSWPMPGYTHPIDDNITYMGAPPVTALLPVTCCSMTWNQRMILTVQLHSSISDDISDTEEVMRQWARKLSQLAGLKATELRYSLKPWPELAQESEQF